MLRKDYDDVKNIVLNISEAVAERANRANLMWVLCVWESPFTSGTIEKRVGYFESVVELQIMKNIFRETYEKLKLPFYIATSTDEDWDGGLFDARK